MPRLVKPLAVVLLVPALAAGVALAARGQWDARWQAGMRRQFQLRGQRPADAALARYSLAAACSDRRIVAALRPCRAYNLFGAVAAASLSTAALGLAFLGSIALFGRTCRSDRRFLLRAFRSGLLGTLAGFVVLSLFHGALALATVWLLGRALGRWPGLIIAGAAAAVIGAVMTMIRVALTVPRRPVEHVVGRAVRPEAQPRLFDWVRRMADGVGAPVPDQIVATLAPALFHTSSEVVALDQRWTGRTLCLPLPLARILSVDEYGALVGHELAHESARLDAAGAGFYRAHAAAWRASTTLASQARGLRAVWVLPVLSVLAFFLESCEPAVSAARRERELAADRAAGEAASRLTLASALVKAHAFAPAWPVVVEEMDRAVSERTQFPNTSALFAAIASLNAEPERLRGIANTALGHPTDSHPCLGERLEALGVSPEEVAVAALTTVPAAAASSVFTDPVVLEQDLSTTAHQILAAEQARERALAS